MAQTTKAPCTDEVQKERSECKKVIDQADKTIAAKNKALELADLAINDCTKNNGQLQTSLNDRNEELTAWYRNPLIMLGLGMAAGIATYALIRR